jgi:6-phosphogluconolactonase (cycloisomerase 2 family)
MRPEDGDGNGTAICDIGAFEGEQLVAGYGSTPVQPGPIDFGNATVSTLIDAGFVVFETGNKTLTINTPALSGDNPSDFAVVGGVPASIADGAAAQDVTLRCTPKAVGLRQATLTLQTNDPSAPTVSYMGTAVPTAGFGSTPSAPGPFDLGAAVVGVEISGSIAVEETGNAQLQVHTPVLGGANPGDFSVDPNLTLTIANSAPAQPIPLKCKPTAYGIRTATLTLQTNDPNRATVSFNLTCTGIDAPTPFLDVPGESVTYPTGAPHGPYGVAVSPDGQNVYATDYGNDRLIVFRRDTTAGNITVLQTVINGAGGVSGVDGSYLVTVSPDGQNVYVTGSTTDTVVSFKRSPIDGTLTFLNKVTRNDPYGFCNPTCPFTLNALDGAYQVAISPDGQYGYVSSILDNKVVVLYRNATTGALAMNPLGGPVQIFSAAIDLSQAYGMAISPDGANMYLTGYASDTLLVLERNAADGRLAQVEVHKNGLAGVDGLNGVFRVTVSPDGGHVYTASFDGNAVTAFRRNPTNGKLTYLAAYKDDVGGLDGLGFSSSVTVSPDGARVLATGFNDDALAIFERDATTGLLTQSQVVKRDATTHLPALDGARDVALSPDGRTVYATGFNDNQVVALHVANPRPRIASLRPSSAKAGGSAFTLYVDGANFMASSQVKWNGADRPTTFVNTTLLKANISAADIVSAGIAQVTVANPTPGGGTSNIARFTITAPNANPVPSIERIALQAALAGGPAFTLDVVGSSFMSSSQVRWNGANRPTTFVSATRLQAQIPAADIAQPGLAGVTVFNPAPGGGSSNAATFTIVAPGQNPVPLITRLDPPWTTAGGATGTAFTLRVIGASFTEDSQVRWNGANRPTTFVSDSELLATITAGDITGMGTARVTVFTPEPGGGESNVATFTIGAVGDNPVPVLASATLTRAGDGSLRLTLNGSSFVAGATVRWNSTARPTTRADSTRLTIGLTAGDFLGTPSVLTVVNPEPGGGVSNDLVFSLRKVWVPLIRK